MKLSIIIPQYQETEKVIHPLLSSIENQIGIDIKKEIEIIIINDGSAVLLSASYLNSFNNLTIIYIKNENNKGPSYTRNKGLKIAHGEYVMFCDADDRFLVNNAILTILIAIKSNPSDIYIWDFDEEILINNQISYMKHSQDSTFIHGKVYNHQFLISNYITFCDELRINEDSYFNGLCRSLAKSIRIMPTTIYVWCYNPKSITRIDNFNFKHFHSLILTATKLIDELLLRNNDYAKYYVIQLCYQVYFKMQTKIWNMESRQQYKQQVEQDLLIFYDNYHSLISKASIEEINTIYQQEKNKSQLNNEFSEQETFDKFMKRIRNKNTTKGTIYEKL